MKSIANTHFRPTFLLGHADKDPTSLHRLKQRYVLTLIILHLFVLLVLLFFSSFVPSPFFLSSSPFYFILFPFYLLPFTSLSVLPHVLAPADMRNRVCTAVQIFHTLRHMLNNSKYFPSKTLATHNGCSSINSWKS